MSRLEVELFDHTVDQHGYEYDQEDGNHPVNTYTIRGCRNSSDGRVDALAMFPAI